MRAMMISIGLFASSAAFAEDGKQLYDTFCATCHGATGKGEGPAAAALNPKPRVFSELEGDKKTKEHISKITKEGGAANGLSPLMAPFPQLTEAQNSAISTYVIDTLAK